MATEVKKTFKVNQLTQNELILYHKADLAKGVFLNGTFALAFYQFDYQSIASIHMKPNSKQEAIDVIPVTKITMDMEGFKRLQKEINELGRIIDEKAKSGVIKQNEGIVLNEEK